MKEAARTNAPPAGTDVIRYPAGPPHGGGRSVRQHVAVKVIFVGGSGRSGSTLVDRVIGQIPGYVSAGELRTVWLAGLGENRLCGCGQPFLDCPFWRRVGDEAFGGWSNVDPVEVEDALASLSYLDALRRLRSRSSAAGPPGGKLNRVLERLYAGIAAAADGATIVDSSKGPRYALTLSSVEGIDLRAIHLVRDSRGVAYSWSKEVTRNDTPGREVQMPRFGAAVASARWLTHNTYMELLGRRVPSTRLRYETFIENPRSELLRILGDLGETVAPGALDFLSDDSVRLGPNHTVMGNPMRMATGDIPLRTDAAWRRELPTLQRAQVTAMTWPMLLRYGYRP
jgi:hypothetical protein